MADSDALRQQRYRRHRQGDHSICTRRCKEARTLTPVTELPAGSARKIDPVEGLQDLAAKLAAAYAADPANATLARELRATLLVLPGARDAGADAEWNLFLSELSKPVQTDDDVG